MMPLTSHVTVFGENDTDAVNCFVVVTSIVAFCGETLILVNAASAGRTPSVQIISTEASR